MARGLQGKEKVVRELRKLFEVVIMLYRPDREGVEDKRGLIEWDTTGQVKECEMLMKQDKWLSWG